MLVNQKLLTGAEDREIEIVDVDGKQIQIVPRLYGVQQMVTSGEQSDWMLPLKEGKLIGALCPKCGQVLAPAFIEFCNNPDCRLAQLEQIELSDTGVLIAEPVVTSFAPARMHGQAPFCHGQVILDYGGKQADVAMMFDMRTTLGVIRRGVYQAGTEVKVVFCDERQGLITDVFCLPTDELTEDQLAKSPLFESDISWGEPAAPVIERQPELVEQMPGIKTQITEFMAAVNQSPRNQGRLGNVSFRLNISTAGGELSIAVDEGILVMADMHLSSPTSTMVITDPNILLGWTQGVALGNSFASGELWLSNREGVRILEDLDRLHRAATRDKVL